MEVTANRIPIKTPCKGYYLRWYYNGWHYWFFLPGRITQVTEGENYFTIGTKQLTMGSGQINYGQVSAIRTIMNAREIAILTDAGWMSIRVLHNSVTVYDHQINGYEVEFTALVGSKELSSTGYTPIPDVIIDPPDPWVPSCSGGSCIIMGQVWSSCNYDASIIGSRVYNDDEANRAIYGGLYTWDQVNAPGFIPAGWHIPTVAEWNTLVTNTGGNLVSAGVLKESGDTFWTSNAYASPVSCFAARGAGFYISSYLGLLTVGNFWTAEQFDASRGYAVQMTNDDTDVAVVDLPKTYYFSVRLVQDTVSGYGALYNWYAVAGII
jgi:uncharacterized protein (TIGR02145 family)